MNYVSFKKVSFTLCKLIWQLKAVKKYIPCGQKEGMVRGAHLRTIYIYCPVWRETWRFVQPRKFMSPEGEARGRHGFSGLNKSSCLPTNWAINCLLYRKLKENFLSGEHALNRSFVYFGLSFSVSDTWRAKHVLWRHSPGRRSVVPWDTTGKHDVWRETRRFVLPPRDFSRPIIFLYSSYQLYEV